ncbi:hypothetical protein TGDOM2_400210, partial [Toxoplasma gondii GAB2-2007-GAL-DOM2]
SGMATASVIRPVTPSGASWFPQEGVGGRSSSSAASACPPRCGCSSAVVLPWFKRATAAATFSTGELGKANSPSLPPSSARNRARSSRTVSRGEAEMSESWETVDIERDLVHLETAV